MPADRGRTVCGYRGAPEGLERPGNKSGIRSLGQTISTGTAFTPNVRGGRLRDPKHPSGALEEMGARFGTDDTTVD